MQRTTFHGTQLRPLLAVIILAFCSGTANAQNQIMSAGYTRTFYAPQVQRAVIGQILTLYTTALDVPDAVATTVPLPRSLSGVSVLVKVIGAADTTGYPTSLPILRIFRRNALQMPSGVPCPTNPNSIHCSSTQIVVEIPTEGVCIETPASPEPCAGMRIDVPPLLILNVQANGVTGPDMPVQVGTMGQSHLFNSCDSVFGPQRTNACHPLITHADGTLASSSNPASVGETITLYGTGLGFPTPHYAPQTGYPAAVPLTLPKVFGAVDFTYTLGADPSPSLPSVYTRTMVTVEPEWVGWTPGYVGLNQINVVVPPMPLPQRPCTGNGNVYVDLPWALAGDGQYICVQP